MTNAISVEDYERAFSQLFDETMHERKRRLLEIMMGLPNQTASPQRLVDLLNASDYIVVYQTIGQLGSQLYRIINKHPEGLRRGSFQTWSVIAECGEPIDEQFPWKLRPNVVEALESLGFEKETTQGEELIPSKLREGAVVKRLVNAYERSPQARKMCLAVKKCVCVLCGFDFAKTYGKELAGFIHVHHLKPLAEIGETYEIDPVNDLEPVCPNCHAVLHYGKQTRSLEEVRKMLEDAKNQPSSSSAKTSASTT